MLDLNIPELIITAEVRHKTCIHEAAHAVIFSIGGVDVYRVEVANQGAPELTMENIAGDYLRGICQVSDPNLGGSLEWNGFSYIADRKLFNSFKRRVEKSCKGMAKIINRIARSHVCGSLAGPIADKIMEGIPPGEIPIFGYGDFGADDFGTAEAISFLLPYREEFEHLQRETERVLREPAIWSAVIRLAEALAATGSLSDEELEGFLPARRRHWPPSPRGRKHTPAQEVRHA